MVTVNQAGGGSGGAGGLIDFRLYVNPDPTFGLDNPGRGQEGRPFLTIAFAITQIPAHADDYGVWANERWTIHLQPGRYTEVGPIIFRHVRRSVRLYGDGAVVDNEVRFINNLVDYPDGIGFAPALVPAPWGPPDNSIPLSTFEVEGEGGGMEGGVTANNIILRGRVLYRAEGVAALAAVGPFFWLCKSIQSFGGWEFENATGVALALSTEIDGSSILNRHIGGDGAGGAVFNLKAHNSQLRGTIGPFCTILEIDSCRISAINRLTDFSEALAAGVVDSSTSNAQGHISDCSFNGTVYNIGGPSGARVLLIDDVSMERLVTQGFVMANCVFQPTNRLLKQNRIVSTTQTLLLTDKVVLASAAAGPITLTLPAIAGSNLNTITIKKTDATVNLVTVAGGGPLIDGNASRFLRTQHQSIDLYSDTAGWHIVTSKKDEKTFQFGFGGTLNTIQNILIIPLTAGVAGVIYQLDVVLASAPIGSSAIFTFKKNGVSIGTVTVLAAALTGTNALVVPVAFTATDKITAEITQVGLTIPGTTASMMARAGI